MTAISAVMQQRFFDCMLEFQAGNRRYALKKRNAQQKAQRDKLQASIDGGKLDIERQAAQNRQADIIARQQFVEFTQAHLHDQVADELFSKLNRFELVASSVFDLAIGFPQVLDTLAARAVTLSQLEKVITPVEWLKDDLLKYVNQPNLRKNASGYIRELKPALGLIGIDSLQQIIPLMALKRCLPHSTDPFTAFKNNFWQYSLDTARAAQRLARETGELPFLAFCAALFQSLGYFVVARTYLRTYQHLKQQAMFAARDARDQELTDALDSLDADGSFLTSCLLEFAPFMSADLMANWKMRMLPLGSLMDQLAEGPDYPAASQAAVVIHQASCFVQCQWLYRAKLVTDIEVRQWFNEQKLRPDLLAILKNTDSSTIEIG